MKALYLTGGPGVEVALDGPALRVRRPGRAEQRYPLQRIARITAVGRVHWRPDAFDACLREGKPVVVLDNRGRFIRLSLGSRAPQPGLARRSGNLLATPRFRERYERWMADAEHAEMTAGAAVFNATGAAGPVPLWQKICLNLYMRRQVRPGVSLRYLAGLAASQVAAEFAAAGLLRDSKSWNSHERRLFVDAIQLERWRLPALLDATFQVHGCSAGRSELTAAFEQDAAERERRIADRRRQALLAMMGLKPEQSATQPCAGKTIQTCHARMIHLRVPAASPKESGAISVSLSNRGRIPFGVYGSFRTSARILRVYLEDDRRMNELYR